MLASYENQLAQEDTVPKSGHALDSKRQELAVSVGTLRLRSLSLSWAWAPGAPATPPVHSRGARGPGQQVSLGLESQPYTGFLWPVEIRCCCLKIECPHNPPRFPVSLDKQIWPPGPTCLHSASAEHRSLCPSPASALFPIAAGPALSIGVCEPAGGPLFTKHLTKPLPFVVRASPQSPGNGLRDQSLLQGHSSPGHGVIGTCRVPQGFRS